VYVILNRHISGRFSVGLSNCAESCPGASQLASLLLVNSAGPVVGVLRLGVEG